MPSSGQNFTVKSKDDSDQQKELVRVLQETEDMIKFLVEAATQVNVRQKIVEPTVSTLEREILIRNGSSDKKIKLLQLPTTFPTSGEPEIVGDDAAKSKVHILCECDQPGVSGGAVPIVTSFIPSAASISNESLDKSKCGSGKMPFKNNNNRSGKSENLIDENKVKNKEKTKITKKICFSSLTHEEHSYDNNELKEKEHFQKLKNEFAKYINKLSQQVSKLTESNNNTTDADQISTIDNLSKYINNLKQINDELQINQNKAKSEPVIPKTATITEDLDAAPTKLKNKDNNRIYIKFLPSKAMVKKRKNNSETQTCVESNTELDSMDGMFIPSFDDPPKLEDDEDDEDGLDITITFPEIQNTIINENASHLSVCFSNISAEALGRLKRCPKEFTLRMDFIQGKIFFQSGKSAANNFSFGPDLKITEHIIVDSRQSDIISIKPSTECLYTSQLIPVEGPMRKESVKILKSTDSELFKVVSMPFINKRNSIATKSCITFTNIQRSSNSESQLNTYKNYYKSMPQIPSLTGISEEIAIENISSIRTGLNIEKRQRTRNLQRKRTNSSLEKIL